MRKFKVTVNGEVYEVSVEEEGADPMPAHAAPSARSSIQPVISAPIKASASVQTKAPATAPAPVPAPARHVPPSAPVQAPRKEPSAVGETVVAPLPGTITNIKVSTGQQVEAGQVMMILEAMKMENEITAPVDGKIAELLVSKGQNVSVGEPMVVIS